MARRIVLSVLALIVVVLGVVAVPLGLLTAAQDMHDFRDETIASATTLANVAEERLDDGNGGLALARTVSQLGRSGDSVTVLNAAGQQIAGTPVRPAVSSAQLSRSRATGRTGLYTGDDWILVVMPVRSDSVRGAPILGTIVLERPTTAVDRRVALLWTLIAAVAGAGLAAAALVAIGLARWVSRPLSDLEHAARDLGDGALGTRAPASSGPDEVRRLAANFNQMAGRLEALVHGHQATMADVSHQLRTPLAALRLRLDLLAQDCDEQTASELAGAQEEIARLSRLVNGLLAVARAENITAAPVLVAVDSVISSRVAAWRPAADERNVALLAAVEPVVARLGDGHLEQILDNLIANALDALPASGSIRIGCVALADRTVVTVADNGPGMPVQQQKLAFRRFATGEAGGIGLGLAIVHRLAVANGGSATLSDTPGGGLTVTIDLPSAARERGQRRAIGAIPGGSGQADPLGQQRWQRRSSRPGDDHHPPG
ncbi:MAG: sensor histidine kinase [Streptosporangiaceae bacterium]